LNGEVGHGGSGYGCNVSITPRSNNEEYKLFGLIYDLPIFLGRDQGHGTRWDYLRYPV
jgi:hypothetical protein